MGVYIDHNKLVVVAGPNTIFLNLTKEVDNSLKNVINNFIKHNKCLVGQRIKNEIEQLSSKYKHGNDIHELRK